MTREQLEHEQNEALIYALLRDDRYAGALAHFVQREANTCRDFSLGQVLAGHGHNAVVAAAKAAGIEEFWAQLQQAARRYEARRTSGA